MIDHAFRGRLEFCYGDAQESIIVNGGPERLRGSMALYYDDAAGVRHHVVTWTTEESLPPEAGGWLEPDEQMVVPAFDTLHDPPPAEPGTYLLVFSGEMGLEEGGVTARIVRTSPQCRRTLWQWRADGDLYAFPLGGGSVPSGAAPVVISPPVPTGHVGFGVAFDPRDGNLWYTTIPIDPESEPTGGITKITPEGLLVGGFVPTGLVSGSSGPLNHFFAIDVDPTDHKFLWVSEFSNYYYRVNTETGVVERTCRLVPADTPSGGAHVGSNILAVGGGRIVVQPFPSIHGNQLFGTNPLTCNAAGNGAAGAWEVLPIPPGNIEFNVPFGIDFAGANLVAYVVHPNDDATFYNLGVLNPGVPVIDDPIASEPTDAIPPFGHDIALGSEF